VRDHLTLVDNALKFTPAGLLAAVGLQQEPASRTTIRGELMLNPERFAATTP
jgi:hypothetical protein